MYSSPLLLSVFSRLIVAGLVILFLVAGVSWGVSG